ncbi:hypothetical protein D9V86_05750 [Bacteroidetes/Chlorobi group bacterium ChocPot_Mid]|nr:MAG: hypothetical protein D9V86_05750 [Bacteroidetes/Chlorobi group bacterium ChocPot_Mid]
MQSQLNPWLQFPQNGFWLNFWQNGRIGVNHAGTDSTSQPLMLLHSFRTISPEPVCYPATLTMQTENCEDPPNLFGHNSIDFWSNHYDSTYKWQTGRIATYTNEEGPFDTLFNYYAGLKFACSGGPSRQGAEGGPVDVMYIYDKKVGIWQSDPQEKLHVGGWIRSDSLAGTGYRSVYADDVGNLITGESLGLCSNPWCIGGNELTTGNGAEYLGTSNSFSLIIKTNNSERMRINEVGDVSIGRENWAGIYIPPVGKLDINVGCWNLQSSKISFDVRGTYFGQRVKESEMAIDSLAPSIRFYRPTGSDLRKSFNYWIELRDLYGDEKEDPGFSLDFLTSTSTTYIGEEEPTKKVRFMGNGNVGIGENPKPIAKLNVKRGAVVFEEIMNGDNFDTTSTQLSYEERAKINALGKGCRFMWIPGKHSLRMGKQEDDFIHAWDYDSCGVSSVAFGHNNRAWGHASQVFGIGNSGYSDGSKIIGHYNDVFSEGSIAIGNDNHIGKTNVFKTNSFAFGNCDSVYASYATAMGNNVWIKPDHKGSFAIGDYCFNNVGFTSNPNQFYARFNADSDTTDVTSLSYELIYSYSNVGAYRDRAATLHPGDIDWVFTSDVSKKEDFKDIKSKDIIDSLRKLPLYNWKWKPDLIYIDSVNYVVRDFPYRFIGPTAQDFSHYFPLGVPYKDKISNGIIKGVLLVSVQELIKRTDTLAESIKSQIDKSDELKDKIDSSLSKSEFQQFKDTLYCYADACKRIEELESKIKDLEDRVKTLESKEGGIIKGTDDSEKKIQESNYDNIILGQNNPNPFAETTEINYYIPKDIIGNASLIITDERGIQKYQEFDVCIGKPCQIKISAKEFSTGVYIYSIVLNGLFVKSQKMLIIK